MYLVKTPWLLKRLYPQLTWNQSRAHKTIYLTFDDGPIPEVTPFVLQTLARFEAKATFFCIGDNVRKHPEVFEQVQNAGHAIGNHTFNHLKGWKTDTEQYADNFLQASKLLPGTNLFRPPYGRIKRAQMRRLRALSPGLNIIMWDVLSGDFDTKLQPEVCLQKVLKHTENGSVVVFHDSLKAYPRLKHVLPRALEAWQQAGYSFQKLP